MNVSPMHTIIADDEPLARGKLRMLLEAEPGIRVIAECENGNQAITALKAYKPDLVILDVQMPEADGFQVLETLSAGDMPIIIFTTAYDQYAIRAFEQHALDYLLKPFDQERLHAAIERARVEMLNRHDRELTSRILDMLSSIKATQPTERRFVIKSGGRVIFLNMDEIDWVEAAANYVKLNAEGRSYLLRDTISRVSERLDPQQFVRIHRSILVNVRKIKELQPCNSGEYMVILRNGKELSCSRSYRAGLHELIENA
ncbi:MAG TPA: LytTR family DNA-binding domain-containing protein [Terriglobales bacterium]|nr:LytTR family DNA-binding domain-containing protein [Terriglobales bacterium]